MRVDIAVVGAGAAGAAAAAILARAASVVLIDRVAQPVWRIGETLPGAARRPLAEIGAWPDFLAAGHDPAPLKISRWGSDEPVTLDAFRDPDGVGWRIDRARFEADLRSNALRSGAQLLSPVHVERIVATTNGWSVVLDNGSAVDARVLIDASGRRSRLLRDHGQRHMVADRLACAYQTVEADSGDTATYIEATEDGWWYSAVLPDNRRLVAFHGDSDLGAVARVFETGPVVAALSIAGLADIVGAVDASTWSPPAMCSAASIAHSAAGKHWLAAGDAALAFDPLSSQGLFNALVTGIEAGNNALAMLDDASADIAMRDHAAMIGRVWQAYAEHHATYYRMEQRWPDASFWHRRHGPVR